MMSKKKNSEEKVKWTSVMTLKLISLVEEHENIYNTVHPKYQMKNVRKKIFEEIGEKLQVDAASCSTKWNSLRSQMNIEYRKVTFYIYLHRYLRTEVKFLIDL